MNATGMSNMGKLAFGLIVTLSATTALAQQLDRAAVDGLLAQAHKAIDAGDFAKADQLVSRCESANIRYPLIHFGDTPSTLRRELTRARNQSQQQTGASDDPFAAAGSNLPQLPASLAASSSNGYPASSPGTPQPLQLSGAPRALPGSTPPQSMAPLSVAPQSITPKAQATAYMQQSRAALAQNDLNAAAQLAARASALNVPEADFGEDEDRPSQLAWDIEQRRFSGAVTPAVADLGGENQAMQAIYNDDTDGGVELASATNRYSTPRLAQASAPPEQLPALPDAEPLFGSTASQLIDQGEASLRNGDRATALDFFKQANARRDELAVDRVSRLDDHLKMFGAGAEALAKPPAGNGGSMLAEADEQQQVLARQLSSDVGKTLIDARSMLERDPKGAFELLKKSRSQVAGSALIEKNRTILVSRVDDEISKVEAYIDANRAQLELDERNADILAEIDRSRELKIEMQTKIAELIEQWNQLRDEQRYAEMDVVAKRLYEMAPDNPVVVVVWQNNKFIYRLRMNQQIANAKEDGLWKADFDIEESSIPLVSDGEEVRLGPNWPDIAKNRRSSSELTESRSVRELEIMQSLKKPVMIRYENQPLSAAMDDLSKMTGVNIVLDPRGLTQEGISSDTRVSFAVNREISLRSALNLILEPLHLSYVVKDEVLKITSEQLRDGELKSRVYNVADLVIPIPNFVPSNNIGLQGLINDAYSATGVANGGLGAPGPLVLANNARRGATPGAGFDAAATPSSVLAQQQQFGGPSGGGFASPSNIPIGGGPGNLGGAANADFDSLIDLIVSTVAADSWAENGGGEAEIRPFPTNLSIVVSQTEAVHEEIADLLTQLRKLQDLQVTIEVRFIRLNDSFFERIGIDFDVNIEDRSLGTEGLTQGESPEPPFSSTTVGLQPSTGLNDFPNYTADLDIPFRQESFNLAIPQFGTPVDVATFGFAILSDIEAYFLINASQGDRRSNVLNAPKVTLFNGQQAFVADTSQTPFVISVIPVVGEFAAAQQPVIVVLSEGTLMTIQAVVSDDRRYVRLTVVPFFSEIGDVQTFTFEGTTSTSTSSSTTDDDDDGNDNSNDNANNIIRSGTTVQLPTFQFVSVTTTVSVPDGGTVLLGGIKRLSEGRNEFGVPLLSKVPYINRLFKNVGIGRETDSLMMMVTPRIIIQEEEEARLLGTNP